MAEKLGKDCNDKELAISKLKNELKDLNERVEESE